jgi:hypothetical protein
MRYVKMFEDFSEEDMDFALTKIKSEYPRDRVKKMLFDEAKEWVIDGYKGDPIEYYNKIGTGEAQEVVLDTIIEWYKREFNKELTDDEEWDLFAELNEFWKLWDESGRLTLDDKIM